ncbi:MAG: AAA family ATPase [Oscillospiraceae bacterium]|jgi:predicted ATP-dependent endonuclease of OLD family|nr:AAA family ATPase [Oscillospiraceae bacterium]
MMTLKRFRVQNFRSVKDSGWIDCQDVTSLVGVNEAGKSNLILALWKLNPVRDGEIDLLHDMPVKEYSAWRLTPDKYTFIRAEFELDTDFATEISESCGCNIDICSTVEITRRYSGVKTVSFPKFSNSQSVCSSKISDIVEDSKSEISEIEEDESKISLNNILEELSNIVDNSTTIIKSQCEVFNKILNKKIKKGSATPAFVVLKSEILKVLDVFNYTDPAKDSNIRERIVVNMPNFVYYSNYGNLDAQIYLPHVIKLLKDEKVEGFDNAAKVRTLKVLFEFVNLKPEEILELGKDPEEQIINPNKTVTLKNLTPKEVEDGAKKKEEREILLQSSSVRLTNEFSNWWKQGTYKFRLHADGKYFRILVSDDKRSEEIALELRSTGLQWFLSFFLIFLIESKEANKGAILLLDEAGLTLHPMAQKDLVKFFDNLAKTNQIVHTTHSPFLIDTNNIDRVSVVYVDKDGYTVVSGNLRENEDRNNATSIYAVHSALGLSISDVLLQGCQPVIVEGVSDQFYLNAIKLYLIKNNDFKPNSEIVFVPSGGAKGVSGVASILCGKSECLPFVLLDSDKAGNDFRAKLHNSLYKEQKERVLSIIGFTTIEQSEFEDIIPISLMSKKLGNLLHNEDEIDFEDIYTSEKPIIPQIEEFAQKYNIDLPQGWKVELAKAVKQQIVNPKSKIDEKYVEKWKLLFNKFNEG